MRSMETWWYERDTSSAKPKQSEPLELGRNQKLASTGEGSGFGSHTRAKTDLRKPACQRSDLQVQRFVETTFLKRWFSARFHPATKHTENPKTGANCKASAELVIPKHVGGQFADNDAIDDSKR